jgi:hypothetical protein
MQRAKHLGILAKVDVGEALASVADSLGDDSQEPEQSPKRTPKKRLLRKVATDDLDFGVQVGMKCQVEGLKKNPWRPQKHLALQWLLRALCQLACC